MARDIGNLAIQERVVSETIQLALFTNNANAVWAAKYQLQAASYPSATIKVSVNRDLFRLQVGDCFKFSYSKYSIVNMIFRVLEIRESNLESERIEISAIEDIFSISSTITEYSAPSDRRIEPLTFALSPLLNRKIVEAPYFFSDKIEILPLACRVETYDLGFDVYMSIDEGASFFLVSRADNLYSYGTLVGEYAESYIIDEDIGFTVNFVQDVGLIETESWANIFSGFKNIAILGNEIISFQSVTPVSGAQYKIENIIRGRFGTSKVDHVNGETFFVIRENADLVNHIEIAAGVTRKFKFVPYNVKFNGNIADATAIDINIEGRAKKPYIPANFLANGSSFAGRYSADIILTWSPRYRGRGAGIGIPGEILPDTDREGLFEIEVWVSDALVRTTSSIDAATWTYTSAMNITDNGSLATEVVFKLLNYRTEDGYIYKSDQVNVTCKKS